MASSARGLMALLLLLALPLLAAQGTAAAPACLARHNGTGEMVAVRERVGASLSWARAAIDPDGWPAITYGPSYFDLPVIMRRFTTLHECAHLAETGTTEFAANCRALRAMREEGLEPPDEEFIRWFHLQMPELGPQFGGSGPAYWSGTLEACGE